MLQLLFHAIGDYIIQNEWMSLNKKKRGWKGEVACQIHCISYSLPFLFIGSLEAVLGIYLTHYILDRTNIVAWFIAIKNGVFHVKNFGFPEGRPFALTIWLLIIIDNTLHILFNYLALRFL
jgi:hypothetical protein